MNALARGIEQARAAVNRSAAQILTDLCDIISTTEAADAYGGSTDTPTTLASNVPCSYKALSIIQSQTAGSVLTGLTHKIKLPSNAITQAIGTRHRIVVAARGNTPAMTFHRLVSLDDAYKSFVYVAGALAE